MAKKRGKQLDFWLGVLVVGSPVILAPVFFKMLGENFYLPSFRWIWAILWASLPDAAMMAAGAANGAKGVLSLDTKIVIPKRERKSLHKVDNVKTKVDKTKSVKTKKTSTKKTKKRKLKTRELTDDNFKAAQIEFPNYSKKFMVDLFGTSRTTVFNYEKKLKKSGTISAEEG